MNRAWTAPIRLLVVIMAIGVAATRSAFARDLKAETPTAAECRQFHADLAQERERDYARALGYEGEARFDGYCFPKDIWRGIDLLERSVANGAEDAALLLRDVYGELGDIANAEKWGKLTALVWYAAFKDHVREDVNGTPLPPDVIAEWRELLEILSSRNAERIVARLDILAARPPIVPKAEREYWWASVAALKGLGGGEWEYAMARGEATRRGHDEDFGVELRFLSIASICNHPRAILDHVHRYLAGVRIDGTPLKVVRALARLHHLTGQHAALLAEAERKLGQLAFGNETGLTIDVSEAEEDCRRLSP